MKVFESAPGYYEDVDEYAAAVAILTSSPIALAVQSVNKLTGEMSTSGKTATTYVGPWILCAFRSLDLLTSGQIRFVIHPAPKPSLKKMLQRELRDLFYRTLVRRIRGWK